MKEVFVFGLVVVATTLSAFAQGKLTFQNDSQRLFVLGSTHPLDTGLGGGSASGAVGAIPASPLPSGYTLRAALYGGTNSDNLTLWAQVPLTDSSYGPGLMAPKKLIVMPADCTTSYWTVVVADYISTNLLQTETLSQYFGSSPKFTLVICGGTIIYPPITFAWSSTWAPGNIVVNYTANSAPPTLTVRRTATNSVLVSWPSPSTGWALQVNTNLASGNWAAPSETIYDDGTLRYIIVNPPAGNRFYQLRTQ